MTIVLFRTISFFIFSTPQNCFSFSSFLYSCCRTHLKPSLLWLPPGYFFGTPGSSCSCSILFAQNLELLLHLHMEFPLLPSFWIKLTLNANFSDNSDSQYTVLGKVLTANSFAKANLRRLDHPDWKDSIFSRNGFSASTYWSIFWCTPTHHQWKLWCCGSHNLWSWCHNLQQRQFMVWA